MNTLTAPRAIAALSDIVQHYDAVFCDVWGVLHDGIEKFAPAEAALIDARARGRPVVLVTNSPRRAQSVADFLNEIGVSSAAYDCIATSGDVTRALIRAASPRILHIGIEAHLGLFAGLDIERVDEDRAEVVVVTGLEDDQNHSPDDYSPLLKRLAERGLPLICANPDVIAPRGDRMVWGAGALARDYAALGGEVRQAGKPFRPIYDFAMQQIGAADPSLILAIGDGLGTDIRGANDYGLDALLVLEGIHAKTLGQDMSSVAASLRHEKLSACYAIASLR
ncbi:TIGR01459 family HAD-type hydrolase [Devosia sp.]|uniref:TIGR01459 family HAD-type hydrolase n=1 Tax=Devosia sp. TaxID=1871048 RepID=UPI002AFE28AE|nr:TIGR01459 family HAD-type hydrolase [Devosia sp.]